MSLINFKEKRYFYIFIDKFIYYSKTYINIKNTINLNIYEFFTTFTKLDSKKKTN